MYNLRALAAEATRVTLEVRNQGKPGGQAHVPDVEGVWLNLVRNVSFSPLYEAVATQLRVKVNRTCSYLTDQVRSIGL